MHNDVVKSDIHSMDSADFSEAVFGIAYLLGFSYAPRFKNLKRQNRMQSGSWAWIPVCWLGLSKRKRSLVLTR
jgi:hypothetical protein